MRIRNTDTAHGESFRTNAAAVAGGRYTYGALLDAYKKGARRGLNLTALILSSISFQRTSTHQSPCSPALLSLLLSSPPLPSLAKVRVTATCMCTAIDTDERMALHSVRSGAQLCA